VLQDPSFFEASIQNWDVARRNLILNPDESLLYVYQKLGFLGFFSIFSGFS
jgi:hypothetical protein